MRAHTRIASNRDTLLITLTSAIVFAVDEESVMPDPGATGWHGICTTFPSPERLGNPSCV